MSVDLYRARRGAFFKCTYWKRDESKPLDNNHLILKVAPNGVFYAKIIAENDKGTHDIANAMQFHYENTTIQTEDDINIEKNDLIFFNNGKWIVESVKETVIQKNSEFSIKTSKITNITIRKDA